MVGKAKRGVTGTRIRYWADRQIFTPDAKFSYDELAARARQTSFLVPGLKLTVRDERRLPGTPGESGPHEEVFHHDGGISEFVDFLAADPAVTDIWRLHGSGKFKETVPVLDERGHSQLAEVERDCEVDVALRWGIGYDSTVRSFVNIISTPKGGTHQSGFEQALVKTFRKAVETNARKLKAGNDKIDKDDIFAGPDRRPDGPPGRAAVRGPDQGDPGHVGRAGHRGARWWNRRSPPSSTPPTATTRPSRRCCWRRSSAR